MTLAVKGSSMNNPLKALNVSDLEMNVLQVAIDQMVEHLEGERYLEYFEDKDANLSRLEAAKRLKRWFAYQPTNPLSAVMQMKESMK